MGWGWIMLVLLVVICNAVHITHYCGAYTMMATNHDGHNHDGHKVYRDGHSNENVKNQRRTLKKSPNSWRIHGHAIFRKHVCGCHGCGCHGYCLWTSLSKPLLCEVVFQML